MNILRRLRNLLTGHEHRYTLRYKKTTRTIVPTCKCGAKKTGFRPSTEAL